ncbi:MAG: GTPase ObgE [Planctomycetota bacterium]|nr:MAG: GTPase ObgE [Planctomycetota bacterium]
MFVDEATIIVQAGNGGNGCVSFRREKYVPHGGPDGGDGGNGGSVILEATPGRTTLAEVARQRTYRAKHGAHGQGSNKTGKSAADVIVHVPLGTIARDEESGEFIADLTEPGRQVVVAKGGRRGRGNTHFASSVNQTPREAEPGNQGETRRIALELKLLAEVGLVGLPNAGKSTLLSRVSDAKPLIADYPFTTKSPVLGVVSLDISRSMVIADLPGLIEGAHEGHGLGDEFLRHVERTSILIHLVDAAPHSEPQPGEAYRIIRKELEEYSEALASKPELVVLTKSDLVSDEEREILLEDFADLAKDNETEPWEEKSRKLFVISAVSGEGLTELLEAAHALVQARRENTT